MITSTTNTETETATTASVEGLVDLLESAGWADEAAAVIGSGCRTQITIDDEMTEAQASVIRSIGLKRGQGMLPCWIPSMKCAIWAHTEVIVEGQVIRPSCYWDRNMSSGAYLYTSCMAATTAYVLPDGVVGGRTRTTAARLAGDGKSDLPAPPDGWESRLDSLTDKYWSALAAFHELPDGHGSQEGQDLLGEVDKTIAEARSIAAAAMAHGAPEWEELPPDWLG